MAYLLNRLLRRLLNRLLNILHSVLGLGSCLVNLLTSRIHFFNYFDQLLEEGKKIAVIAGDVRILRMRTLGFRGLGRHVEILQIWLYLCCC